MGKKNRKNNKKPQKTATIITENTTNQVQPELSANKSVAPSSQMPENQATAKNEPKKTFMDPEETIRRIQDMLN